MIAAQRKKLRAQAHGLKPVVTLGQSGLTEAVLAEIDIALEYHQLIKIKIRSDDRDLRKALSEQISEQTQAELIQRIGQISVFYRRSSKK